MLRHSQRFVRVRWVNGVGKDGVSKRVFLLLQEEETWALMNTLP